MDIVNEPRKGVKPGFIHVSDISSAFGNHHKVPQDRLEAAAIRGQKVHSMIHAYMNDIPHGDEHLLYLESFKKFWGKLESPKILMQEERLYCDQYKITGAMDMVVETVEYGTTLIDWKCTWKAASHWEIQASGYAHLALSGYPDDKEPPGHLIDTILFVRLDRDGGQPEVVEFEEDPELFEWAHRFYIRYMAGNKCHLEDE